MLSENTPLISVIVPVYNVSVYLRKCIESIRNSTYINLEIILVDDGSTDDSGNICDHYEKIDDRITVIHKKNGGLSSARNAGLDIATGLYISFIDSDDYISDKMFEAMLGKALDMDADIVQCGVFRVDEYGNLYKKSCVKECCLRNESVIESFFTASQIPVMLCNKLFKKQLISSTRMVESKNNEDNMFMIDILCKIKCFVSIEDAFYYYLNRADSIMNKTFSEKKLDSIFAYNYVLNRTNEFAPSFVPYVNYWRCMNSFYLYYDIWKSNVIDKNKYYQIVEKEFQDTYPYVRKLKYIKYKDRIRLMIFNISRINAVKLYHSCLKNRL